MMNKRRIIMDATLDIPLQVTVRLGKTKMSIKQLLKMGRGAVLELDNLVTDPIELLVNGKVVALGEVEIVGDNYGIKITEVLNVG
jgi:flagellar motor switch protein FliN/FliY